MIDINKLMEELTVKGYATKFNPVRRKKFIGTAGRRYFPIPHNFQNEQLTHANIRDKQIDEVRKKLFRMRVEPMYAMNYIAL